MIEMQGVAKWYGSWPRRRVRALHGVSLRVAAGARLGVIGLNGAGKSTLLRLLLGYLRPSAGALRIDGLAPRAYVQRHGIAYVPERVAIPARWTVRGALRAYALLGEVERDLAGRVGAAMDRLGLAPLAERRVGHLSKGNLQRLAIAQALLAPRALLVLDEPTDALDPLWTAELRTIVDEWHAAEPGRTVLLASHNLHEVERMVDEAVVLHAGEVRDRLPARGAEPLEARLLERVRRWQAAGGGAA